jgi:hypothetical protein
MIPCFTAHSYSLVVLRVVTSSLPVVLASKGAGGGGPATSETTGEIAQLVQDFSEHALYKSDCDL